MATCTRLVRRRLEWLKISAFTWYSDHKLKTKFRRIVRPSQASLTLALRRSSMSQFSQSALLISVPTAKWNRVLIPDRCISHSILRLSAKNSSLMPPTLCLPSFLQVECLSIQKVTGRVRLTCTFSVASGFSAGGVAVAAGFFMVYSGEIHNLVGAKNPRGNKPRGLRCATFPILEPNVANALVVGSALIRAVRRYSLIGGT